MLSLEKRFLGHTNCANCDCGKEKGTAEQVLRFQPKIYFCPLGLGEKKSKEEAKEQVFLSVLFLALCYTRSLCKRARAACYTSVCSAGIAMIIQLLAVCVCFAVECI